MTARHTAKLADGGSSGEFNGTGVLPKFPRVDQPPKPRL